MNSQLFNFITHPPQKFSLLPEWFDPLTHLSVIATFSRPGLAKYTSV